MVRPVANQCWLMKSEPESFGISDLKRVKVEPWSGVRNYMARNHMRAMKVGDRVLFHHSNVDPPGVAGLARVARTGVVDETQFDPDGKYFDPKATRRAPIWDCVDVAYVETLPHFVTMDRMRAEPALADMMVLRRGMRLSVQPATLAEYEAIVRLGHTAPESTTKASRAVKPTALPAVADVRALRVTGRHDEHRVAAASMVRRAAQDVYAQIEAAYASDFAGDEHRAIRHYDAAHRLGVPAAVRREFLVGYGSTLRNVGRAEEAIAVLAQAVADDPHYPPFAAFLALALMSAGQPRAALATMLGCALDAARPDAFERYTRALGAYHHELLEVPPPPRARRK